MLKLRLILGTCMASFIATPVLADVVDRPFFQSQGVVVVWGDTDFIQNPGFAPIVSDFLLLSSTSGTAADDIIATDVYAVRTGSLDPISNAHTAGSRGPGGTNPVSGQTSGGVFTDNGGYVNDGIMDASDTLTAFGLDVSTDITGGAAGSHHTSFYVASNAVFDIFAQSANVVTTGDFSTMNAANINFDLSIQTSGSDTLQFSADNLPWGANAQDPSMGGSGIISTIDDLSDMSTEIKVFDGGQKTAATNGTLTEQSVRFDMVYQLDQDTVAPGLQPYDFSMGTGTIAADVTFTIFTP